jgi:surfactin synthase thioesterase subunit
MRASARRETKARLFCFPYAGVGASVYRSWIAALPVEIDLCPIQLPGREGRFGERAIASLQKIVDELVPALLPHLDRPYAFFGHSMGSALALEVARALATRGEPGPRQLFVSARRPPHVPDPEAPLHGLPDREFVAEINRRYGGIPAEVLAHQDLLELLLPTLRADITALETHRPPRRPPLACPIVAFGGADDPRAPRPHLEAWRGETTSSFRLRIFPGDHFYLTARRAELLADIAATLAPLLHEEVA